MHPRPSTERGFTLIEAVLVIMVTGIVIVMLAIFIVPATTAYFASSARAQLSDQADTALRRIARDLAGALPNSTRVNAAGTSLELIPTAAAARYAVDSGDTLRFGVADASFDLIGPGLRLATASQRLAWSNLGNGVPDADAYAGSNVRTAGNPAGTASNISLGGAALPVALQAPPYRVYAIELPVSYRCDGAGNLLRHSGYGFSATQPNPPSGGSTAVLARGVSACAFALDSSGLAARWGLVSLRLALTRNDETVTLYQTVHVDNLP